jgi:hypothetical protein
LGQAAARCVREGFTAEAGLELIIALLEGGLAEKRPAAAMQQWAAQ